MFLLFLSTAFIIVGGIIFTRGLKKYTRGRVGNGSKDNVRFPTDY